MKQIIIGKNDRRNMRFEEVAKKWTPLVGDLAKKWWTKNDYDDLFQEGLIGLWKAYQHYNSDTGVGFGYYAKRVISQALYNYNRSQIHERMKNNESWVVENVTSLNIKVGEDGSNELGEIIGDDRTKEVINKIVESDLLEELFGQITDKEKEIIILHVIDGYEQTEIAKMKNTNRQNISNWYLRALEKLRTYYLKAHI